MNTSWETAQKYEQNWWGTCVNTLYEEQKQLVYADKMGLERKGNEKTPYIYDSEGASVIDIGGGACSILLKCVNFKDAFVVDPLDMPEWVKQRYNAAGITFINAKGEDFISDKEYDETWIYNVLQHTENPQEVILKAKKNSKIIRIFEWIDTPISDGHIHTLTEKKLNNWLNGYGKVENINKNGCKGKAYYGIFPK